MTKPTAQKRVKIKIPLTRTEKEDVWGAINGVPFLIKRGAEVEVSNSIAELLENSDNQNAEAMEYEAQLSSKLEQ
jgi:hypothetical protein